MTKKNPFEGEVETPDASRVERLRILVAHLYQADQLVGRTEAALKEAQQAARQLREHDIPGLMDQLGLKEFTMRDGTKVSKRTAIRAKLPADPVARREAFAWIESNGKGGLIKNEFTFTFDRTQAAEAKLFEAQVKDLKVSARMKRVEDIHNGTLCAFLKEQHEAGVEVPLKKFGGFVQNFAHVNYGKDD